MDKRVALPDSVPPECIAVGSNSRRRCRPHPGRCGDLRGWPWGSVYRWTRLLGPATFEIWTDPVLFMGPVRTARAIVTLRTHEMEQKGGA